VIYTELSSSSFNLNAYKNATLKKSPSSLFFYCTKEKFPSQPFKLLHSGVASTSYQRNSVTTAWLLTVWKLGVSLLLLAFTANVFAFHKIKGLSREEKHLVEAAYMSGAVSVLCCTPTLALGVNMPARR
jgi:hypothetical protein